MSGFIRTNAMLPPVDILRQAGVNFACRYCREDVKQVIFNNPATVVLWSDGTKTVVKCSEDDTFNPEIGLAMAICKKAFGNTGAYNDVFKKWVPGTDADKSSIEEMRNKLVGRCHTISSCETCKLHFPVCKCGCGYFFDCQKGDYGYMTDEEIVDAYNEVFGE